MSIVWKIRFVAAYHTLKMTPVILRVESAMIYHRFVQAMSTQYIQNPNLKTDWVNCFGTKDRIILGSVVGGLLGLFVWSLITLVRWVLGVWGIPS